MQQLCEPFVALPILPPFFQRRPAGAGREDLSTKLVDDAKSLGGSETPQTLDPVSLFERRHRAPVALDEAGSIREVHQERSYQSGEWPRPKKRSPRRGDGGARCRPFLRRVPLRAGLGRVTDASSGRQNFSVVESTRPKYCFSGFSKTSGCPVRRTLNVTL